MNPLDLFTTIVLLSAAIGIATGLLLAIVYTAFRVIDEIERMT